MEASPNSAATPQYQNDEIDLFELFEGLWREKLLIIAISAICLLGGALFAFLQTPVYQGTIYLLPPNQKDIFELKKADSSFINAEAVSAEKTNETYSVGFVYSQFLQTLSSNQLKRLFFNKPEIKQYFISQASTELSAWKNFEKAISINLPKKGNPVDTSVSFQANDPQLAADWANQYLEEGIKQYRKTVAEDAKGAVKAQEERIKLKIANYKQLYTTTIDLELIKLKEALTIAKTLDLNKPLKPDSIISDDNNMMVDEIRKLYRPGTEALTAEISAFEKRRDSNMLIKELPELNQELGLLSTINIDTSKIYPVSIDLPAEPDNKPLKPKKALILALSLVLGGMLGVFVALIRQAIRKRAAQAA